MRIINQIIAAEWNHEFEILQSNIHNRGNQDLLIDLVIAQPSDSMLKVFFESSIGKSYC